MQERRYSYSLLCGPPGIVCREALLLGGIVRKGQGAIEKLGQVDRFAHRLLRAGHFTRPEEMAAADFIRRNAHGLCDPIHVPLDGKQALRRPKTTKGAV